MCAMISCSASPMWLKKGKKDIPPGIHVLQVKKPHAAPLPGGCWLPDLYVGLLLAPRLDPEGCDPC